MHTLDEIAALLHIHKTAHEVGNLTNISGAALNRLRQLNSDMGPDGFGSDPRAKDKYDDGGPAPAEEPKPDTETPSSVLERRL